MIFVLIGCLEIGGMNNLMLPLPLALITFVTIALYIVAWMLALELMKIDKKSCIIVTVVMAILTWITIWNLKQLLY